MVSIYYIQKKIKMLFIDKEIQKEETKKHRQY